MVRPLPQGRSERRSTRRRSSSSATIRATARRRRITALPADEDDLGRAARQHDDERRDRQGRAQRARHRRTARDVRRHDRRPSATRARRTGTASSRCSRSAATRARSRAGGVKLSAASGTATIKLMDEAVRIAAGKKLVVYSQLDVARAELGERALSRSGAAGRADHDRPRDAQPLRADEGRLR